MSASMFLPNESAWVQATSVDQEDALKQERTAFSVTLIERVIQTVNEPSKRKGVELLAVDDLMDLAEAFLKRHQEFRLAGKPMQVTVGFHYTRKKNLGSIRGRGLMSSVSKNVTQRHGAALGKESTSEIIHMPSVSMVKWDSSYYSFKGNKLMSGGATKTTFPKSPYFDEIILRNADQVLPVLFFPRELVNDANFLHTYQVDLQRMVDDMLNTRPTPVPRILPTMGDLQKQHELRRNVPFFWMKHRDDPNPLVHLFMRPGTRVATTSKSYRKCISCPGPEINAVAADRKNIYTVGGPQQGDCSICHESMSDGTSVGKLKGCGHAFHQQCLDQALRLKSQCAICRNNVGSPFGQCPNGTLEVRLKPHSCSGYTGRGTYELEYSIPSGYQSSSHDNPGHPFSGTIRTAYIPDCTQGRELLPRLEYAFACGLTFGVGTSLTSGRTDVVIWASIHHKTSRQGGAHGYPDPGYFMNVKEELDALGVPT